MRPNKMWQIVIRIKRNDNTGKKRTFQVILDFLKKNKVSGATVWTGVNGYGKRGDVKSLIEGLLMNYLLMLEIIDETQITWNYHNGTKHKSWIATCQTQTLIL